MRSPIRTIAPVRLCKDQCKQVDVPNRKCCSKFQCTNHTKYYFILRIHSRFSSAPLSKTHTHTQIHSLLSHLQHFIVFAENSLKRLPTCMANVRNRLILCVRICLASACWLCLLIKNIFAFEISKSLFVHKKCILQRVLLIFACSGH